VYYIQFLFFQGRVVAKGIGGGIKHKYHWIAWIRSGPKEGNPVEERVIQIMDDGCRTAKIALVAGGDELKYILATENMKPGDIIKTSGHIPRIPGWLEYGRIGYNV
jgi:large subunit ribosomal protein L2